MKALILIDLQYDFLPNGSLAVANSDEILPTINNLQLNFEHIIATRDWHPANHKSFASNHKNKQPGEFIELQGLSQVLWPDHCVQGSPGAEMSANVNQSTIDYIVYKGTDSEIDSYSAFFDNGRLKKTELDAYLKRKKIKTLYVAGLATDYCVYFTVLDGLSLGYEVFVIEDACRAVNLQPDDGAKAIADMKAKGANIILSKDIL